MARAMLGGGNTRPSLGTFERLEDARRISDAADQWLEDARAARHSECFEVLLDRWAQWRLLVAVARAVDSAAAQRPADARVEEFLAALRETLGGSAIREALPGLWDAVAASPNGDRKRFATIARQLSRIALACGYETERPQLPPARSRISAQEVECLIERTRPQNAKKGSSLKSEDSWFRLAFYLVVGVGLRPSELLALRWSDIDTRNRSIAVRRAFMKGVDSDPTAWTIREVPAYQCRAVSYALAAFDLADDIDNALRGLAKRRGVDLPKKPETPVEPTPIPELLELPQLEELAHRLNLDTGGERGVHKRLKLVCEVNEALRPRHEAYQEYCRREMIFVTEHKPPQPRSTPEPLIAEARWLPITPASGSLNSAFRALRGDGSQLKLHDLRYVCADAIWANLGATASPGEAVPNAAQRLFARQYLGLASLEEALRNLEGAME